MGSPIARNHTRREQAGSQGEAVGRTRSGQGSGGESRVGSGPGNRPGKRKPAGSRARAALAPWRGALNGKTREGVGWPGPGELAWAGGGTASGGGVNRPDGQGHTGDTVNDGGSERANGRPEA